jgi:tetratricopeptide (TPR) repeat protein
VIPLTALALAVDPVVALRTDPARVAAIRDGAELLYARRLPEAKALFDDATTRWPTSGIGPLGIALLYQERMFENEDFRFEGAYATARDATRAQVEAGSQEPGDEALEDFVLAGILGVDAIHLLRRHSYVASLGRAYEAMRALGRCEEAAPDFVDPLIGDGMFLYWRTVVSHRSALIPNFPDKRPEGMALLRRVESEGAFLGPAASLALTFAFVDQKRPDLALRQTERLTRLYPQNVLVRLATFEVLLGAARNAEALEVVAALDPQVVPRVWFHRGVVLGRLGRWSEAASAYRAWIDAGGLEPDQLTQGWFRLGDALVRAGDLAGGRAALTEAADRGHKPARKALAELPP